MTLMVSSTTLDVPGMPQCDGSGDADQLCVAVWEGGEGVTASNTGLWPEATWWGLTFAPVQLAIDDKAGDADLGWFSNANCIGEDGCSVVHVYHFSPGSSPRLEDVYPPN